MKCYIKKTKKQKRGEIKNEKTKNGQQRKQKK